MEHEEDTLEIPACEPSWSQRAEERIRNGSKDYADWHRTNFGYPLMPQKHISAEEIHHEKDRMLQEQAEYIEELQYIIHEAKQRADQLDYHQPAVAQLQLMLDIK